MKLVRSNWLLRLMLVTALVCSTALVASAEGSDIKLGIRPIGVEGSYFSLTMSPGETRDLTVELGNFGAASVEARTFAADAYTIVNGGFGIRLDGEASGGVTDWLAYPAENLSIEPGTNQTRTFTVSVPADAKPGEYIAGLVIQNATPISTSSSGSVAINQVIRQAIAVAVTVPGPLVPGLAIGQASYKPVGERSVLRFEVKNTGNMHLKPSGEFVLKTADGQEVSRGPIAMDSFYAGTETFVEGLLAEQLNPGDYVASLSLSDAKSGATVSAESLQLAVPVPEVSAATSSGSASNGAAVNQAAAPEENAADALATSGSSTMLTGAAAVGLLAILAIALLFVRRRGTGHPEPAATTATASAAQPAQEPAPPTPVQIRQLRPAGSRHQADGALRKTGT